MKIFHTTCARDLDGQRPCVTTISDRGDTCVAEDMSYHVDAMSTNRPSELRLDDVAERSCPMRWCFLTHQGKNRLACVMDRP